MSIPQTLEIITTFGIFSGYRIDWNKSELMSVRLHNPDILNTLPFKVTPNKFTYLGIQITRKFQSI